MKSHADETKKIATKLLAGMLANPHLYQVYLSESGKLNRQQRQELIQTAIAMAEELIESSEIRVESRFQHHLS